MRTNEYSYDKNDLIMIYTIFPMTFLSIGALFILLGFIKIILNDNTEIINELIKFGTWIGDLAVILTLSYQFYVKYKQVEIIRIYKNKNSYRLYIQHIHQNVTTVIKKTEHLQSFCLSCGFSSELKKAILKIKEEQ